MKHMVIIPIVILMLVWGHFYEYGAIDKTIARVYGSRVYCEKERGKRSIAVTCTDISTGARNRTAEFIILPFQVSTWVLIVIIVVVIWGYVKKEDDEPK